MNSHQGFLTAVERDLLAGDAQFPTGLKVLAALRRALDDPRSSVERVTALVGAEPLVVARLLRLANCVTFNPGGHPVLTVQHAVQRVGFNMVRSAAAAVAVAQMRVFAEVVCFSDLADAAWLRSVQLSVLARLLAPGHEDASPDEAALCGLVSELGTFYLLQRAAHHGAYSEPSQRGALELLLLRHGPSVTARLAAVLGLPEPVAAVLAAWQPEGGGPGAASGLQSVMAEACARREAVFSLAEPAPADATGGDAENALVEQARAAVQDLLAALGG